MSAKSKNILVVEDSDDTRTLLFKFLRDQYNVTLADSGYTALEMIQKGTSPDLVLLDLSMKGMSGCEFLAAIREEPKCAATKVLIVSGWSDAQEMAQVFGADGCFRKPISQKIKGEVSRYIDLH